MKDPRLVHSSNVQLYGVVREYVQALRTNQVNKAQRIREVNQDLKEYLDFADREYSKTPFFTI